MTSVYPKVRSALLIAYGLNSGPSKSLSFNRSQGHAPTPAYSFLLLYRKWGLLVKPKFQKTVARIYAEVE